VITKIRRLILIFFRLLIIQKTLRIYYSQHYKGQSVALTRSHLSCSLPLTTYRRPVLRALFAFLILSSLPGTTRPLASTLSALIASFRSHTDITRMDCRQCPDHKIRRCTWRPAVDR